MDQQHAGDNGNPVGPPPGGNWNSGGVQVTGGSTVHGPVAGGQGATVRIIIGGPPAAGPAGPDGLRAAAEQLRAALARIRAEQPDTVAPEDAEDADAALAEILAETDRERPREGVLRRRVGTVVDALRTATLLAAAVAGLESAFAALLG
ncbi:hypothetical protein RMN57_33890 [Kitasatospora sp. CM 4170]|uniref:Uncharacterized protein n=1 Tax=Kitasatospora aburaviensis TaxID=67265 RepID=A0ABW1F0K9_9ACTN|nr:hypothetical protein [Kitasatospora sp. CM 4170]WNM49330.1 hypothetical protein RMN57_33890 [Kitasatospora sp. CM 4170]